MKKSTTIIVTIVALIVIAALAYFAMNQKPKEVEQPAAPAVATASATVATPSAEAVSTANQ